MLSKTFGSAVYGIDATTITVEVNVLQGRHFFVVGLPDSAVKESEHRIESSIKQIGYFMPRQKGGSQPGASRYSQRRISL